jgi:hypothetical protein
LHLLTDKGRELMHVLLALQQWGDRHKADPRARPWSPGTPSVAAICTSRLHARRVTWSSSPTRSSSWRGRARFHRSRREMAALRERAAFTR